MPTRAKSKTITRDPDWPGPAVPPGEMLFEEFLKPLGLRQSEAAEQLGISANRLNEVVLGKRRITADTALRLSQLLKTSPQFWMRLQADWDLQGRPSERPRKRGAAGMAEQLQNDARPRRAADRRSSGDAEGVDGGDRAMRAASAAASVVRRVLGGRPSTGRSAPVGG